MNVKKKFHIVQTIIWIITIITLFVIIVLNKSEQEYNYLQYVFYAFFLIVPLIMTAIQLLIYFKYPIEKVDYNLITPFVAKTILIIFSFISFYNALNAIGKTKILITIIVISGYNLFASFLILKKEYKFKTMLCYQYYPNLIIYSVIGI